MTPWPLLAALALGHSVEPPPDGAGSSYDPIERFAGYSSVVLNHINRTIETAHLPTGNGQLVEPGVFVTVGLDRVYVFDQDLIKLNNGRVANATVAVTSFTQQQILDGDIQFVHDGGEVAPAYSVTVSDGAEDGVG